MQIVRDCETLDIGGKAANLCRLREFCNVPPFFVIRFDSPDEIDDPSNQAEILAECSRQGFEVMAVRSSASCEDSDEASFAGMFETRLGVTAPGVLDAVRAILNTACSPRVVEYAEARGLTRSSIQMAVVIQQLVHSRVSGVCLTRTPTSDTVTIEACYGLGEALVSGTIQPDTYLLDTGSTAVLDERVAYQSRMAVADPDGMGIAWRDVPFHKRHARKLDATDIRAVGSMSLSIERALGFDGADVEWTFHEGRLHVLQARPLAPLPRMAKRREE